MLAANRHEEIIKLINKDRFVKVSQLSRLFDVSEETIRRDLDKLEKEGLLKKLHGGAVPIDINSIDNIKPIMERITENIDEKAVIAKLALDFIEDGDTILLDSGSTTLQLAKILDNKKLTVITNDISIAYELSHKSGINLIVAGGSLRRESFSVIGSECEKFLNSYNVRKAFISASGVKLQQGLTTSNTGDAYIKKAMMNAADTVICTSDHTKFDRAALFSFASFDDIDILITDKLPDNSYIEMFSETDTMLVTPQD
jgi:DeoR family glycerol-3-phosphate regulon repressor/DeoR family myo-inositol catabolism operon transcriptional repressor